MAIANNPERYTDNATYTYIVQVENGKNVKRKTVFLNLKGVIAFCEMATKPKAIPFQKWADKILAEHIEKRIKAKYGDNTEKSILARKMETVEWQRHGAEGKDYRDLTLLEYELLGFEEDKRKGNMSPDEILKLAISNLANTYQLKQIENPVKRSGIEKVMDKTKGLIDNLDVRNQIKG